MKKQLLIEIDAGQAVCRADEGYRCDYLNIKDGSCDLFMVRLVDGCARDPMCLKAERAALAALKSAVEERDAFRAAANAYLDIIGERHKERDALRAEVEELRTRLEENEVCVVEGVGIPSV